VPYVIKNVRNNYKLRFFFFFKINKIIILFFISNLFFFLLTKIVVVLDLQIKIVSPAIFPIINWTHPVVKNVH
jgi:hypothetical protein